MLVEKSSPSQPLFSCLQRRVGSQTFDTWFRPLRITSSRNERVVRIAAPSAVVKDWILTHYSNALRDSLAESKLDQYKVEWILASRQCAAVRQSPLTSPSSPLASSAERRPPHS